MNYLILRSNHLNEAYIKNVDVDEVFVVVTKEQFEHEKYHQFRILYHISASYHFAKEHSIQYIYKDSWDDVFKIFDPKDKILMYEANDVWMDESLRESSSNRDVTFIRDINFYFIDIEKEFSKAPYKLDPMYRRWRRQFNILMEDGKPIGGSYSHDGKNRNSPPKVLEVDLPLSFTLDDSSKKIYQYIEDTFIDHPKSRKEFIYPVTRKDALRLLDHFIHHRLPFFGYYQDAMMENKPFMIHSLVSSAINLGLLMAKEVVDKVCKAYYDGIATIEAVEGFVRQVLGWREYIRGIYLIEMKNQYHLSNSLKHEKKLPSYFYDANTPLHCMHTVISETIDNAYNHHIERLMILGNISNLLSISPGDVRRWFNEMYIDSFDWVVTPNVLGMALYADGGKMSTKPYISSANYIKKMSNYCSNCRFDPTVKSGEKACPVTALYYSFLHRHKDVLGHNPRMKFMYMNYNKLSEEQLEVYLRNENNYQ